MMTIGLSALPSFSSTTVAGGSGNLAFRHVACLAKHGARLGATAEDADDIVLMDEMDDAREERDRSEIMDSGLERDDTLARDGRRDVGYADGAYGY